MKSCKVCQNLCHTLQVLVLSQQILTSILVMQGPEPKPVSGAYTIAEDCEVPGLSLIKDFVTSAEEQVWSVAVSFV